MKARNNYKRSVTAIEKDFLNVNQAFKILNITKGTDSSLLIDRTEKRNNLIYIVARFILLFNTLFFIMTHNTIGIEELIRIIAIYILSILIFYVPNILSDKIINFNRTTSTIKRDFFFNLKENKMPLSKVDFYYTYDNRFNEIIYKLKGKKKFFYSKIGNQGIVSQKFSINDFNSTFSFLLWYMDKNRPLPPGESFDPYREKDFLRRRAEGFPPPLYRSYIPTPEVTPAQQAEREHYWTDEQYTEKFEREEGSEWYDPEIHSDWEETSFYEPNTKIPVANRYVKFIFNDGRIIYSQTNEDGGLFEPPESEDFEMQFVNIKK